VADEGVTDEEQSPFERPVISEGYPLDKDEEQALRKSLDRMRDTATTPSPSPRGDDLAEDDR
jgi:hypothetical protein